MATFAENSIEQRYNALELLEKAKKAEQRLSRKMRTVRIDSRTIIHASPATAKYMKSKLTEL